MTGSAAANSLQLSQIDKKLASEFDNHLKTVMLNLSNALRSSELTVKEKNSEVLKSKFFLYDVCFEKAIQYLNAQEQHGNTAEEG